MIAVLAMAESSLRRESDTTIESDPVQAAVAQPGSEQPEAGWRPVCDLGVLFISFSASFVCSSNERGLQLSWLAVIQIMADSVHSCVNSSVIVM